MDRLHSDSRIIIENGRKTAYHAVNSSMVKTYWELGHLIVEEEHLGKERAEYSNCFHQSIFCICLLKIN